MRIITLESKYWAEAKKHGIKRADIRRLVREAAEAATKELPEVSPHLNIVICPADSSETIKETGDGGITYSEEYMSIVFDYAVPFGAEAVKESLRTTTMHEMVHAASYKNVEGWIPAPLQSVVYEGLATVYQKKHSQTPPLWSEYGDDATMQKWLDEIKTLPTDVKNFDYLFDHPDGRRWIIYKTGTWMIEKLLATKKHSFNELMNLPYKKVIRLFEEVES